MPASQTDISATIDGRNGEQGILLSRSWTSSRLSRSRRAATIGNQSCGNCPSGSSAGLDPWL